MNTIKFGLNAGAIKNKISTNEKFVGDVDLNPNSEKTEKISYVQNNKINDILRDNEKLNNENKMITNELNFLKEEIEILREENINFKNEKDIMENNNKE